MTGGDTIRASIEQRERLLTLIGDPVTPGFWRGRALDIYGRLADEPSGEVIEQARALDEAIEVFRRLWALHCRVELLVGRARRDGDLGWCEPARTLLAQLTHEGAA